MNRQDRIKDKLQGMNGLQLAIFETVLNLILFKEWIRRIPARWIAWQAGRNG